MPHHAPFSIQDIQSAVLQGREAERARIIALLESLREKYNLSSTGMNEIEVAKYEALCMVTDLVRG